MLGKWSQSGWAVPPVCVLEVSPLHMHVSAEPTQRQCFPDFRTVLKASAPRPREQKSKDPRSFPEETVSAPSNPDEGAKTGFYFSREDNTEIQEGLESWRKPNFPGRDRILAICAPTSNRWRVPHFRETGTPPRYPTADTKRQAGRDVPLRDRHCQTSLDSRTRPQCDWPAMLAHWISRT